MSQNGNPKKIKILYNKTNSYRTYHADGFFGGITPNGKVYIEPYIDLFPTPKSIEMAITKEGKLGNELARDIDKGTIREIEAGLIFDISVAQSLITWLGRKIEDYQKKIKPKN